MCCYTTTDFIAWRSHGIVLDVQEDGSALAADRIGERPKVLHCPATGKYVMYIHAETPDYGYAYIGVAVADNPAGPYKAADQPLVTRTMEGVTVGQAIDPSIFTDPNTGKSYILYGNGSPAIAELNDDMVSIKPVR